MHFNIIGMFYYSVMMGESILLKKVHTSLILFRSYRRHAQLSSQVLQLTLPILSSGTEGTFTDTSILKESFSNDFRPLPLSLPTM